MLNFFARVAAAMLRGFAHFARRAGDLSKAAALEAQAAVAEAAQPLVDRLPALKEGALLAGAGLALAADRVLGIPGAVARTFLPAGEPTAAQVADAAVAGDDAAQAKPRAKGPTFGSRIQAAAGALLARDEARIDELTPHVTAPVMDWLRGLTPPQLRIVQTMDRHAIEAHVMMPGTVTPGLPRFDQAKAETVMTPEERRRIVAAAMSSLRDAEDHHKAVVEKARDDIQRAANRPVPGREITSPGYGYGM